jgi:hypothetical protein
MCGERTGNSNEGIGRVGCGANISCRVKRFSVLKKKKDEPDIGVLCCMKSGGGVWGGSSVGNTNETET